MIVTFVILSAIILYLFYDALKVKKVLPVYNPSDITKDLVDADIQHIKKYHKISDFSLTNQHNSQITLDHLKGKIHIANFFFTTCQGICPMLTRNMKHLQEAFKKDENIVLLSFSVTPDIDSVDTLKEYALNYGVIENKWHLLTGNKKQIYNLARKSYMAVKTKGDGGENDMIHTENFILVDKETRIRGVYNGTDMEDIERLMQDIGILMNSYNE